MPKINSVVKIPKIFRVWSGHNDNKDKERKEIARIKTYNINDAISKIKNDIFKNEVTFYEEPKFNSMYLILDACKKCDLKDTDKDICDDCEYTEFIEIKQDDEAEESLIVDGEKAFYNLTIENVDDALINLTLSRCK